MTLGVQIFCSSRVVTSLLPLASQLSFEAFFSYTTAPVYMDRDAAVEAVVALGGVATLAVIMMWIGSTYRNDSLTADGGLALVGAIAFFIVFMSIIGVGLSRRY